MPERLREARHSLLEENSISQGIQRTDAVAARGHADLMQRSTKNPNQSWLFGFQSRVPISSGIYLRPELSQNSVAIASRMDWATPNRVNDPALSVAGPTQTCAP